MKFYMFRAVPLPIIRSLFTVHSAMVHVIEVCRLFSRRTRHVEFHTKINLGNYRIYLVLLKRNLSRCTITCHDAQSLVTMHGHMNVKSVDLLIIWSGLESAQLTYKERVHPLLLEL